MAVVNEHGENKGPSSSFADGNFSDSRYSLSSCKDSNNVRHFLDFLYINIFIQQLLAKNNTFNRPDINCKSNNLIYLRTSENCGPQYVGETALALNKRMNIHLILNGCGYDEDGELHKDILTKKAGQGGFLDKDFMYILSIWTS